MKFNTRLKLILASIVIMPILALGITYAVRVHDSPRVVVAASNASQLPCISESTDVAVNQCVTWVANAASSTRFMQITLGLLVVELGIAVAVLFLLRATQRVLFLRNFAAVTGAILASTALIIVLNIALFPHSQQGQLVGATKINGAYQAAHEPTLGYGPGNISLLVLISLVPSLGLAAGSVATVLNQHRKYGGMTKEKLFQ